MNSLKSNLCFVIMPFNSGFKNQWELAIEPCIEKLGLKPWRGDDESLGANMIMKDVTNLIYQSEIIVADLTGRNPNVMYELGLAHAAKKNVIIITQNESDIPFDVKHIRYLEYDVLDLKKLQSDLTKAIKSSLDMPESTRPDYFPELKLMNQKDKDELQYLKERARRLEVEVYPPVADIFFNDSLVGDSPQLLTINTQVERNTLSVAAIGYFEHHQDITSEDIERGIVNVTLELKVKENTAKRVPRWLRFRKRDPQNPVLMRAIAQYLNDIGEVDEAKKEIEELIKIAPYWHMAHNQYGFISRKKPKEALAHYKQATLLNPDNHVGYYNQACALSRSEEYGLCISQVSEILKNPKALRSYSYSQRRLASDSAFDGIKSHYSYKDEFNDLVDKIHREIEIGNFYSK